MHRHDGLEDDASCTPAMHAGWQLATILFTMTQPYLQVIEESNS